MGGDDWGYDIGWGFYIYFGYYWIFDDGFDFVFELVMDVDCLNGYVLFFDEMVLVFVVLYGLKWVMIEKIENWVKFLCG